MILCSSTNSASCSEAASCVVSITLKVLLVWRMRHVRLPIRYRGPSECSLAIQPMNTLKRYGIPLMVGKNSKSFRPPNGRRHRKLAESEDSGGRGPRVFGDGLMLRKEVLQKVPYFSPRICWTATGSSPVIAKNLLCVIPVRGYFQGNSYQRDPENLEVAISHSPSLHLSPDSETRYQQPWPFIPSIPDHTDQASPTTST